MQTLLQDIRYALRQMRKGPGFTFAVVLTLALGIGANAAIFSVINAVLRHPSGVGSPDRLAVLNARYLQYGLNMPIVSVPDYRDAVSLHGLVESAGIEQQAGFNIERDGTAQHLDAARVSMDWFRVFGARPVLGRTFSAEEEQPNADPVTVIGYSLWQQQFGGASNVLGKTILLDRTPYRVIGVMRSDFDWPRAAQLWVPIALPPAAYTEDSRFNEQYTSMVRLRPGASLEALNAGLAEKVQEEFRLGTYNNFGHTAGWSLYATHLSDFAAGPLRKPLYVLFGVVVLVLLIASANVAGLFLARSSARSREFAIRTALGANAGRMVRQLFVETMLLAGTAALLGVLSGPVLGRLLLLMVPQRLAEGFSVHMEPSVLAFTAVAALATAVIAGIGPALGMARRQKMTQLREGGRSATASVEKQRLRSAMVIGEVALAFLLLAATGLFLTSLRQLQDVNPGFNPHGVFAAQVFYSGQRFQKSQSQQAAFVQSVVANLESQHGVEAAAIERLPFDPAGPSSDSFTIEGRPDGPNQPMPHSNISIVTPGYLKVMQIPLLAGRWFTDEDRAHTQLVTVIDARLAHHYWPHSNPIGQHLNDSGDHGPWLTVVGVVATIRNTSLEEDTSDGMRYEPFAQTSSDTASFVLRSSGDPSRYAPQMKSAVQSADSSQAVGGMFSMDTLVDNSLASRRLIVYMLSAFAGLALLLAVIGIYGLISFITAQRTGEVGVRMALGAQRSEVVWLILSAVFRWIGAGLIGGTAFSMAALLVLRHFFADFGAGAFASFFAGVTALAVVGGLAGLLPARRAASIDPVQALRNE